MTAIHPVDPPQMGGTSILQKLLAVMKDCGYIQKDKKNTFHGYSYASEAAIKDRVHAALTEHGVIPQISLLGLTEREIPRQGKASEWLTTANIYYKFWCCDTGEFIEGTFYGCGIDPSDKGLYKAITGAIKYLLTSQFLIPTGDDPEGDEGRTATPAEKKGKQDDYVRSKGLEPYVPLKHQTNQPPPDVRTASEQHKALILETAKMLDEPPASTKTIEMRSAAQVAEADEVLKQVSGKPPAKKGAISFEALKDWGNLKAELRSFSGTDAIYYSALKAKGFEHANQIDSKDNARALWVVLNAELTRLKHNADSRKQLEHCREVLGAKTFDDILGLDYGCESIEMALDLDGTRFGGLLKELDLQVQERKGKA